MNPDVIALCREKGLRITGQRRALAHVIATSDDHPDAQELHRRAALKDPTLSIATVYRMLKLFAELGVITQHSFDGRRVRFESAGHLHHDHLIDGDTGEVIEFSSLAIEELQVRIARELGYELTGHRLDLYGRKRVAPRPNSLPEDRSGGRR